MNEDFGAETNIIKNAETKKFKRFSLSFLFSFPASLIVLHVAVALYLGFHLSIWKDEASTLYTTGNGFLYALRNVSANEKQAPLYFLVLSLWRALDASIFFARIFSIISSAAAIKFFYDLARRFTDEPAAKFLAAFFALHPFLFWASTEIRVYSPVILFSILLLKFFDEEFFGNGGFSETKNSIKRSRIYFVLTAIVALYTNYYLGFVLVGGFFALLVLRRFRSALDYFWQMIFVGAAFLPLLLEVKQEFAVRTVGFVQEKSIGEALSIMAYRMANFIFPLELSFHWSPSAFTLARICFLLAATLAVVFFLLRNKFRTVNEQSLAMAVIIATICGFLLTSYFLLGAEYIVIRHFSVLFAPFVLLTGTAAANALPKKSLIYFAVSFVLLFPYTKIYKQFPDFAKQGDWARVARFIEANEKPDQAIVVFPNFDALSLPFYYTGKNTILPDRNFFAWNFEDSPSSQNAMRSEIEFVISEIPPEAPEIWLATGEICQTQNTAEACRPLENFIEAHYTVEETKDFYLERLRLLRRK